MMKFIVTIIKIKSVLLFFLLLFGFIFWYRANDLNENQNMKTTRLTGNPIFQASNDSTISLDNLLGFNNRTLLFRITKKSCSPCVNREIFSVKEHMQRLTGINFVILTHIESGRDFEIFKNTHRAEGISCFNFPNSFMKLDTIKTPYFVLIDSGKKVLRQYVVDKKNGERTSAFLKSL